MAEEKEEWPPAPLRENTALGGKGNPTEGGAPSCLRLGIISNVIGFLLACPLFFAPMGAHIRDMALFFWSFLLGVCTCGLGLILFTVDFVRPRRPGSAYIVICFLGLALCLTPFFVAQLTEALAHSLRHLVDDP